MYLIGTVSAAIGLTVCFAYRFEGHTALGLSLLATGLGYIRIAGKGNWEYGGYALQMVLACWVWPCIAFLIALGTQFGLHFHYIPGFWMLPAEFRLILSMHLITYCIVAFVTSKPLWIQ
jgi:hypothetical protein